MSTLVEMNPANAKPHEHEFWGTINFKRGISFSLLREMMWPIFMTRNIPLNDISKGFEGIGGMSFKPHIYEPDPPPESSGLTNPCVVSGFDIYCNGMADRAYLFALNEMMTRAGNHCHLSELTYVNHTLRLGGEPDFKLVAGSTQDILEWKNKDRLCEIKKELESMGFEGSVTIQCARKPGTGFISMDILEAQMSYLSANR
jgi:hypothetical protein